MLMRRLEMPSARLVALVLVELCLALNYEEKRIILDKHNFYRSQTEPSASDMIKLTWDSALEAMAKSYAEKCIWEHNKDRGFIGENLFVMSGSSLDVALGLDDWHKERGYYNFTTGMCQEGQMCGHYTQMVWAGTERVGCGQNFCPKLEGVDDENMYLLVCNYEPPGNFEGESPYKEGSRCTECPSDHVCIGSLCENMNETEKSSQVAGITPWADSASVSPAGIRVDGTHTNPVQAMEDTSPTRSSQPEPTGSQIAWLQPTESSIAKGITLKQPMDIVSSPLGSEGFSAKQKTEENGPTQPHTDQSSTEHVTSPYSVTPGSNTKGLLERTVTQSVPSTPQPDHSSSSALTLPFNLLPSDKPFSDKPRAHPVVRKPETQKDQPFQPQRKTSNFPPSQPNPKAKGNGSLSSASASQGKSDQYKAFSKKNLTFRPAKPPTAKKWFHQSIRSGKSQPIPQLPRNGSTSPSGQIKPTLPTQSIDLGNSDPTAHSPAPISQ
ncbi:hypothetical protein XENTR_v10000002 [Xenopus tropicalis]|nr:hypothetical protein XENTR_v10000002 [Xenopus tropicalis]